MHIVENLSGDGWQPVHRVCFLAPEMMTIAKKRTTTMMNFIIQTRRCKVRCVHRLCSHSSEIILAGGLHLEHEHRRTLHPTYHKLPSSESPLTRPRKRWLHQNILLLPHMRCVHVGREITTFKTAAVVNVALVSCFAGITAVDADVFSATVAHRTGFPLTHPRSFRIPPPLIPLHRRPLNEFVTPATM